MPSALFPLANDIPINLSVDVRRMFSHLLVIDVLTVWTLLRAERHTSKYFRLRCLKHAKLIERVMLPFFETFQSVLGLLNVGAGSGQGAA